MCAWGVNNISVWESGHPNTTAEGGLTLLPLQPGLTLAVHDIKAEETQSVHPILIIYSEVKGRTMHRPVS